MEFTHSVPGFHGEQTCFSCAPDFNFIMAKYHKELSQLLELGAQSFEDELKKIVSNMVFFFIYNLLILGFVVTAKAFPFQCLIKFVGYFNDPFDAL